MSGFTKEIIAKTFTELLDEKPMSKITVKDIVERCGVNRNTFYYHFKHCCWNYAAEVCLIC